MVKPSFCSMPKAKKKVAIAGQKLVKGNGISITNANRAKNVPQSLIPSDMLISAQRGLIQCSINLSLGVITSMP